MAPRKKSRRRRRTRSFKHVKFYEVDNVLNETFTLRGNYEVDFANCLNDMNILWNHDNCIVPYMIGKKVKRYLPDFWIPSWNAYVETKGYFSDKDRRKLRAVLSVNDIDLLLAFREDIDFLIENREEGVEEFRDRCRKNTEGI